MELITLVAGWFPERQLLVSGHSAYDEVCVLQPLPANVDLISHVHPKGVLYESVVAPKGQGRLVNKGRRLPGVQACADEPTWL